MIKKISLFITLLLIAAGYSPAQTATGSWKIHPLFSSNITKAVETPSGVYYLVSGTLYGYDTENDETTYYSDGNLLDASDIKNIYYNPDKDYLAVAFTDANISLIFDRGNIVNLPEFKNSLSSSDKVINDITFGKDRMYVATNMGLVVYNDKRLEVEKSGIYEKSVKSAAEIGDYIFMEYGQYGYLIDKNSRINSLENFRKIFYFGNNVSEVRSLGADGDNLHGVIKSAEYIRVFNYNPNEPSLTNKDYAEYKDASPFMTGKDCLYFSFNNNFYKIDATGTVMLQAPIPEVARASTYATWNGPEKSFWSAGSKGVANYSADASGSLTVLRDWFAPDNYTTVKRIGYIRPSADKNGFITYNLCASMFHPGALSDRTRVFLNSDLYDGNKFTDITPKGKLTAKCSVTTNRLPSLDKVIGPTTVFQDPDDPSVFYYTSASEGLYVIKDGNEIAHFYSDNSPLTELWGCYATNGTIDRWGNLWVTMFNEDNPGTGLMVLPASKRKNITSVTKEDWISFVINTNGFDGQLLFCEKSDYAFITSVTFKRPLVVFKNTGEVNSSMEFTTIANFIDQDSNTFMPMCIQCMVEDKDGRVWLGTDEGVLEITSPASAMTGNFRINRVKVPRNDGTNLADYLLGNESVTGITVDSSNRKWISTLNSGIYLVSPRGDEIIANYTVDNSPLPTNTTNCIYADPNSNSIFIGTNFGLVEYSSDSSPANPDYSDVYAYPNPVKPDYSGWVTIKGLMDNSLLKICDSSMSVVNQIQSEGGMALWDVSDSQGRRVRSGVYYVLASQYDGSQSSGDVVAKILVVN